MNITVNIEKLQNDTLKQVAKDLGWNGKENLYDWLEENTKRFDCNFDRDDWLESNIEDIIIDVMCKYKEDDIVNAINSIPADAVFEEDRQNILDDCFCTRRVFLSSETWKKIKETLEDYNDISNYKWDKRYEIYQKEFLKDDTLQLDDISCQIDNEGNVLVEIKER